MRCIIELRDYYKKIFMNYQFIKSYSVAILFAVSIVFLPVASFADTYPCDAITIPFNLYGAQNITLLDPYGGRTILNATILNYSANVLQGSWITCGDTIIAQAYNFEGNDNRQMAYSCFDTIMAHNLGPDNSTGQIVYVDRDISTSPEPETCGFGAGDMATSTLAIYNGFSYGEIVLTVFLFIIILELSFILLLKLLYPDKK